jgi:hypothetical protein
MSLASRGARSAANLAARRVRERKAREELGALRRGHIGPSREDPPPEVIEEAVRAYAAPRSITAMVCGDPPPGRSALHKR